MASKTIDSTVLRRNKIMAAQGGTVSHYFILVNRKFFGFMSLFRHSLASRYRPFSSSCDLFIRIVLNFTFEFKVLTDRNKRSETL